MWRIDRSLASADHSGFTCKINIAEPNQGLGIHLGHLGPERLATLWGLQADAATRWPPLGDWHVRGDDLIATYRPSRQFPFDSELKWQLRHDLAFREGDVCISLLVALRTDLLDTTPTIELATTLPSGIDRVATEQGDGFVGQAPGGPTVIEYASRQDVCGTQVCQADPGVRIVTRTIFSHFLEKGVLRCGQFFAYLAPAPLQQANIERVCNGFAESKLPLSA